MGEPRELDVIEAALFYVENGFAVIPLHHIEPDKSCSCGNESCPPTSRGKHPRIAKWRYKDDETKTEKIVNTQLKNKEWVKTSFQKKDNIGIITGKYSGVVVIDIDNSGGLSVPEKAAILFQTTYDKIPLTTLASRTGGGGLHIFYVYDSAFPPQTIYHEKDGNMIKLAEFKTDGNLVVEYPSNHVSGERYVWIGDEKYNPLESGQFFIEPIPEIIKKWLRGQTPIKRDYSSIAPEGGRHERLKSLAAAMRRLNQPEEAIRTALRAHRDTLCAAGGHRISDKEIDDLVAWAIRLDRYGRIPPTFRERMEERIQARTFDEYSDQQLALEFKENHKHDIRWCSMEGRWYAFNAIRWVPEDVRITSDKLRDFLRKQIEKVDDEISGISQSNLDDRSKASQIRELLKVRKQLSSRRKFDDVLALSKAMLDVNPNEFDILENVINLQNCTVILKSHEKHDVEIRQHAPEDMLTKICRVDYDPDAKCPEWQRFLDTVQPSKDIQNFLRIWVGYCMFGHAREEKILVNTGSGGNGKNTFFNAIRYIFGDYSSVLDADQFMDDRGGSAEYYRASMHGKRLIVASETRSKVSVFNDAFIKQIAGEEHISGRHPYGKPFEFKMQAKANLLTNNLPSLVEVSPAVRRRLLILEWKVEIRDENADRELGNKLKMEASGILNWILKGVRDYNEFGLVIPDSLLVDTSKNLDQMDMFNDFCQDVIRITGNDNDVSRRSDLWRAYAQWCKETHYPMSSRIAFFRRLEKAGARESRINGNYVYRGIQIYEDYLSDHQREEIRQNKIKEEFRRQAEIDERKFGQKKIV